MNSSALLFLLFLAGAVVFVWVFDWVHQQILSLKRKKEWLDTIVWKTKNSYEFLQRNVFDFAELCVTNSEIALASANLRNRFSKENFRVLLGEVSREDEVVLESVEDALFRGFDFQIPEKINGSWPICLFDNIVAISKANDILTKAIERKEKEKKKG